MLIRTLSMPAEINRSSSLVRLPLVFTWIVPWSVLERIRRTAGSMTWVASKGSPSQPWPKLTIPFGNALYMNQGDRCNLLRSRCERYSFLTAGYLLVFLKRQTPQTLALQVPAVGSGASYRPRKKFFPAGHPYVSAQVSRCFLSLLPGSFFRMLSTPAMTWRCLHQPEILSSFPVNTNNGGSKRILVPAHRSI